jgi:radical SAM protein with 4Fe4S-binding SPASM domain
MALPEISVAEFARRLNKLAFTKRLPFSGSLELTHRCNLRCVHCYCNLPAHDAEAAKEELRTDEVLHILDQAAEAGCLWLLLTGGEPLLRKDFKDLFVHAKRNGFIITLFTNGTLINPDIAEFLADWRPHSIEITLYGATQATYERITGMPGSFERCLRGVDLLLKHKAPVALKTMVLTLNHHEVFQIKAYAENLGTAFRFDPVLNPRLDGSGGPLRYRLTPQEAVDLDIADQHRAKEWRKFCARFSGPSFRNALYTCGAGVSTFHIDPYGRMSPCEMARHDGCDLREGSFRKYWDEDFPEFLSVKPKEDYPCNRCELISLCGQCPGWGWLENRDPEKPVDYLCKIAHLRAAAFR